MNGFRLRARRGADGFCLEAAAHFADETVFVGGDNGAGKTTLLRALAGLHPAEGWIRIGGHVWLDSARGVFVPPERRRVGFVWAETVLLPWLDVAANIRLGAEAEDDAWFGEVCMAFDVEHLLARDPAGLSRGEAQRVMLARAFHRRPDLLLLDEPLSAQAPAVRARLRAALVAMRERLGAPLILVSHDPDDAAVADRRWRMRNGRLIHESADNAALGKTTCGETAWQRA